jgi:outer membrane protein
MKRSFVLIVATCAALCLPLPDLAQTSLNQTPTPNQPSPAAAPQSLTLAEAQAIALRGQPRLLGAQFTAQRAAAATAEARSAYFPQVAGNVTGADAETNSRITAGDLNNPTVYDRVAAGVQVNQLATDFGRTHSLVKSADLEAKSQQQNVNASRENVILQVDEAYFRALEAQAVLQVSQQVVDERQVAANQIA